MNLYYSVRLRGLLRAAAFVAGFCLILPIVALAQGSRSPDQSRKGPQPKVVLAHLMPWYVTQPTWGMHWTGPKKQHNPEKVDADGLPDIWSHYHPLIGLYHSADRNVIECQLLQMKLAGIDGVIVDWYGIANVADYPKSHEATKVVFEMTEKLGMQFAVCFEDRTFEYQVKRNLLSENDVEQHLTETMQWLQDNWFQGAHYVTLDGRPLLLNFGPIFVKDSAIWQRAMASLPVRPNFFALHHLWKNIGADGGFTWVYAKVWENRPQKSEIKKRIARMYRNVSEYPNQIIASALPGFRDVYKEHYAVIDHRDGDTLKESLIAAMRGSWPIVQLVTWNDYGEGTMIEPTHEFGYRFLEIVQTVRRNERGKRLRFSPDDLRLPAKLYELRRAQAHKTAQLDRIAELLSNGETLGARAEMDRLSSSNRKQDSFKQVSVSCENLLLNGNVFLGQNEGELKLK